jgi:hypothetical protein
LFWLFVEKFLFEKSVKYEKSLLFERVDLKEKFDFCLIILKFSLLFGVVLFDKEVKFFEIV